MARKLMILIACWILPLLGLSLYAETPAPQTAPAPQNTPTSLTQNNSGNDVSLLFLQSAAIGNIDPIANQPGFYTLTLHNISPYTSYFSERPHRIHGLVPTERFVKAWGVGDNNFATNNPNCLMTATKIDGAVNIGNQTVLVSLSNPIYDSKAGALRYIARPLYAQNFLLKGSRLEYVTLVID
jgi:hypothetical protein